MAELHADSSPDNPAKEVIKLFGGATAVSRIVGISRTQVHKWTISRERRGAGGRVPRRHWPALLDAAKSQRIALPKRLLAPELERR